MILMSSGASSSGIGFDPFTPTATFLIPCTSPVHERGRVSSFWMPSKPYTRGHSIRGTAYVL